MSSANGGADNVTILLITGDPAEATELTSRAFAGASVTMLTVEELRSTGKLDALARLRSSRPDALILFGHGLVSRAERPLHVAAASLAGASSICLMEPGGRTRMRSVRSTRSRALARLAVEPVGAAAASVLINAVARMLTALVRRRGPITLPPDAVQAGQQLRVVYLRSELSQHSGIGGTASHSVGFVRALSELGHEVHAIASPPPPDFDDPAIATTVIPFEPTAFTLGPWRDIETHLRFLRRALPLVRRDPPDLIVARHRRFDASSALLALIVRRPLVLQHEGSEELVAELYEPTSAIRTLRTLERLNHETAASIQAVSDEVVRDLVENRGVAIERVEAARSGVDTRRFHPGAGGADRRRELGIAEDAVVLGFCGTFGPWHGVEHLVEAAIGVPPDLPMHYLFVGDGEKRAALQSGIAQAGGTAATFTGLVPLAQMPTYLDACDVLACPTRLMPGQQQGEFFGSPTKLFEYMAAGKAIIASDVGQIPEVIDHGRTGILFHEGRIEELRDAIVTLAGDAELRGRLGSEARREIVAHGGWRRNASMAIARAAGGVTAPKR